MTPELNWEESVQLVKDGQSSTEVAERLLRQLSEDERLGLLDGDVDVWSGSVIMAGGYSKQYWTHGKVDRLGIPGVCFIDGPRGVIMAGATTFPVSMARGATWDVELEERIGHAIGLEARAHGSNLVGSVCINLPRHPAWGRIQETYGDDPIILGELGAAATRGLQRNVMACAKHFALNSIENARFMVDVEADESALHEVFLPHFKRVSDEGVACIMSAYNSVNGEWAGQNKPLLTGILRDQWGFEGYVISDFMFGLRNGGLSIKNGLDIEAPFRQQRWHDVPCALEKGELSRSEIDRSGRRILSTVLRHYANRSAEEPKKEVLFSQQHRDLARESAARAMVLLQNENVQEKPLLPLVTSQLSQVAIIGRLSNTENTGDRGSSRVVSPEISTPYQGIKAALPETEVVLDDSDDVESATKAADSADIAIVLVGYTFEDEGESIFPQFAPGVSMLDFLPPSDGSLAAIGMLSAMSETGNGAGNPEEQQAMGGESGFAKGGDRESLHLRSKDIEIIQAVTAANPRTVVVLVAAGAVIMEEWRHQVPALLVSWYSGCEGGHALADVLLGKVDASGRLPFVIPKSEKQLPFFDKKAAKITYDRWYGQRLIDRLGEEAAFPLGYGLGYTSFTLADLSIAQPSSTSKADEALSVTLKVSNTSSRDGRYVVQVYGKPQHIEGKDFPSRVLLGFLPVDVKADQSVSVSVQSSTKPLKEFKNGRFEWASKTAVIEVGAYSGDPAALSSHYVLE